MYDGKAAGPRLAFKETEAFCMPDICPEPAHNAPSPSQAVGGRQSSAPSFAPPLTVLLADQFDDATSGWPVSSEDTHELWYEDGVYRMAVTSPSWTAWASPLQSFSDVRVEADQTALTTDGTFGLTCRREGSDFYAFFINGEGEFGISRRTDDGWDVIVAAESSEAIAREVGSTNRLRADCLGETLSFYVNDVHVVTTTDASLTEGRIGLMVSAGELTPVEAMFDNVTVYEP
jgi:hypothetical protein